MALFPLRKPRKEQAAPPSRTETVEAVRRRALHRLIGAAVLVVAGVIGFPLIFDNQPRPIPVDLPIEIADKDKVPALQLPPAPSTPTASAATAAATTSTPPAQENAAVPPPAAEPARAAVAEAPSVAASAPPAPPPRAEAAPPPTAPAAPRPADSSEAQKARALLEGRAPATAAAAGAATPAVSDAAARFVVQVGAFAEESTLREVRRKVERAGFKTYTQTVTTKEGARTRVRVGPFEDRSKAQQAADSIRQLGLSPSVLTL